jgi:hypothetical protein
MALGKAFIEVHADTAPFARELAAQLEAIIRAADRDIRTRTRRLGRDTDDDVDDIVRRRRRRVREEDDDAAGQGESFGRKLLKGLIDTLDDGLSGLPAEIKAGLAAVLIALAPFAVAVGAALATAILAGLTIGGLGFIGVKFASQFQEVQDKFADLKNNLRNTALQGAEYLVRPFLNALDEIGRRFTNLDSEITSVFQAAARTVVPLTDALLGFVEELLPGLNAGLSNIDSFFGPLQVGLRDIGKAVGELFNELIGHPEAAGAFYDLLVGVEDLIELITFLTGHALSLYGVFKDIITLGGLIDLKDIDDIEMLGKAYGESAEKVGYFGEAIKGTIAPTDAEIQAIDELNKQIALLTQLTVAQVSNQIAFEQGLDDLKASLKENKDTLNLHNQAGRDNAEVLLKLAQTILQTRDDTIQLTGDTDRATAVFNKQTAQVYALAKQMGLSRGEVDKIIGSLLKIPAPKQSGITSASLSRLESFNVALREAIYLQGLIDPTYNPRGPGGQQKYAEGGIVTGPTNALIGEAGPEAVIPLSKPGRAAEIMNQAGLTSMVSPNINVYIGNRQIDAYIDARVGESNAVTARSLAYGSRSN